MEKTLVLKAQIRERTGSKSSAKVRSEGRIPAIIYGHQKEPVAISIDRHNLVEQVHHGRRLLDVQLGRTKEKVLVKDLQMDHLGKEIIHADFMRVDEAEMVKVTIPVEFKGTAKGTQEGGIVEVHASQLEIECRVSDIPEKVVVLVKDMNIGDSIHAGSVQLPEGVKLISSPELLLVSCGLVTVVKTSEELEAEAPAVPEVIGKGKEEAEEEEQIPEKKLEKKPEKKPEKKEE